MARLFQKLRRFLASEDGPSSVEYAVMLALIIVVCVSTISALGIHNKEVCDFVCGVLGKK